MKKVVISLIIIVGINFSSSARVGETMFNCAKRYGKPLSQTTFTGSKLGLTGFDKRKIFYYYSYRKNGVIIFAVFDEFKTAVKISYKISKIDDIMTLLEINSDGAKWEKFNKKLLYYKRSDGKLSAFVAGRGFSLSQPAAVTIYSFSNYFLHIQSSKYPIKITLPIAPKKMTKDKFSGF
jgi:hypothetical protein